MKLYPLYTCLLLLMPLLTSARGEWKKGREVHFFTHIAGDFNVNNNDVQNSDSRYAFMKAPNTAGGRIGLEFMYIGGHRVFLSNIIEYCFTGQKLNLTYEADKTGYNGSDYRYSDKLAFVTQSIDWKWKGGYSFKATPKHAIELSVGLNFSFPINGMHTDTLISGNVDDAYYKEPVLYYSSGWGTADIGGDATDETTGVNLKGTGQLAIRFIEPAVFNNRSIKTGLDFGYLFAGEVFNHTEATFYGKNRTVLNQAIFKDRHFTIGISVSIEL